jgi:hypothetical protein
MVIVFKQSQPWYVMDDFGAPAEQTDLTINQLWQAITTIPKKIHKWNRINDAQLTQWFVVNSDSISVQCNISNTFGEVVTWCKIFPSKTVEMRNLGFKYNSHQNARIEAFMRVGSRWEDLLDIDSAVRVIGGFLDPETRPPILVERLTVGKIDLSERCETIDKILDFVVYYNIRHSRLKDPSSNTDYGVLISSRGKKKYSKVEIIEARFIRLGPMPASVNVSHDSMTSVKYDFENGVKLMSILKELGLDIEENITHSIAPTRLKCIVDNSIAKSLYEKVIVLMADVERKIDKLVGFTPISYCCATVNTV